MILAIFWQKNCTKKTLKICQFAIEKTGKILYNYFGYYFITQIISTIFGVLMVFVADSPLMEKIGEFISAHPVAFIHILLCTSIVFAAAISFVFFYITRRIMTKKLNLE